MLKRYRLIAYLNKAGDARWVNDEGTSVVSEIYLRKPDHYNYIVVASPPEFLASNLLLATIDRRRAGLNLIDLGSTRSFPTLEAAVMAVQMGALDG